MKKIAVIDLGSNSVRMSIFDEAGRTLSSFRSTIRLSEGMTGDMVLKVQPQMRAVEALKRYREIIDSEGIEQCIAVATAAVRKAKNRQEFPDLVKETTGIELKVIDGSQEAALDSLAIEKALGCKKGLICDIGGGSTELIAIGAGGNVPMVSIPYGSRGLCEIFFDGGETAAAINKAQAFADNLVLECRWLKALRGEVLVGIGGTLRALAKLDLEDFGQEAVEGYEAATEHILKIAERIEKADVEERKKMPGIGERADIILGGIVLLRAVINTVRPNRIAVADVGVREGVFWDWAENLGIL